MSDWLSLGGGVLDTGLGFLRDHLQHKRQEEINAQNWEQEQQAATDAFNRQLFIMDNYQTPEAQRRLLEQAGLNVGMMYAKGGGGMSGGGASVAKAQGASAQAAQMQANLNVAKQTAEIANLKAQAENTEADTAVKEQDAANKEKEGIQLDIYNQNLQREIDANIANTQSETDKNNAQKALYDSEKEAQDLANQFQKETWDYDVENKRLENKYLEGLIDETAKKIDKMSKEIDVMVADIKLKTALMQKAISEMFVANQTVLTQQFERHFAKMMSPIRFNSAIAEWRIKSNEATVKELETIKANYRLRPGIVKYEYWRDEVFGYIGVLSDIASTVGSVYQGAGMYKFGKAQTGLTKAQTAGQNIKNKKDNLDYKIKLDQNSMMNLLK